MFLAIDVGNSQTTIGLIENGSVERRWRLKTDRLDTSDELDAALRSFLALDGIALADVHAAAVASVVPVLTDMWRNALAHALGKEPFIVSAAEVRGIEVAMPYPSQIGADRIADAVEARGTYGSPAIVVDFGTATNIDVVDARGRYRGGCIAPGLMLSASALFEKAAKLASIPIEVPPAPIGDTTEHALQSGLVLGVAAQAEGLVARIKAQLAAEEGVDGIDCPSLRRVASRASSARRRTCSPLSTWTSLCAASGASGRHASQPGIARTSRTRQRCRAPSSSEGWPARERPRAHGHRPDAPWRGPQTSTAVSVPAAATRPLG